MDEPATCIVVGGGIAGVTCVEQLSLVSPGMAIVLITASPMVKVATRVRKLTRGLLEDFDVEERTLQQFSSRYPDVRVIRETVVRLDSKARVVYTDDGRSHGYRKLCICAGASPKILDRRNPFVVVIRDTESVKDFRARLKDARRLMIVGNGGIATELAYEIEGCSVIWAIKDRSIGATFFDPGAAEFFLPHLKEAGTKRRLPVKRKQYSADGNEAGEGSERVPSPKEAVYGSALGPDWSMGLDLIGPRKEFHDVRVEYGCEVERIYTPEEFIASGFVEEAVENPAQDVPESWPVYVKLTNGKIYGCSFVVSATGVTPNVESFASDDQLAISEDGGLSVNEFMQTSAEDVYAAGDVCSANWKFAKHWFQMRLWTQARQMGAYAARCMAAHLKGEEVLLDFCFEMFTHVTKFFGYKVILLGLYNAQSLGRDYELLLRTTKGMEYIKVVLQQGKMQGAILIGETDLEETFENLILNQMDLSAYGEHLLDPGVDIEDYFD